MHDEHNDTTSGTDTRTYLVDRREYLKATGAAAASVAGGVALTGTTGAAEYDTITVSSGNVRSFSLGDGDTLENKLIDITADGAGYSINASGDNWAIRNVGVRGTYGASEDEPIVVACPDGGSGVIENVYLGDGTAGSNTTGIYVHADHSGHIDIDGLNVQGWTDNGLYGSGPGNGDSHLLPGGGGTVVVTNSYSASNHISNFRLGTTGSYLENCVSEDGVHRSFWGYYEDTELRDCDLTGASIVVGEDAHEKGKQATVTANNCRYDVDVGLATSTNEFSGSSQGSPDTTLPDDVPTTPEEAASGSSGGGGGGGGSPTEVAEDFSHNDIPGTYSLDTSAFTTTSARSTSDSYSIRADDSADSNQLILREDMVTEPGNTYELDVYFPSDTDMGFRFGAQSATGYSDYTGYSGFFDSNGDEISLSRWENGSLSNSSATAATWPLDEWLTVELDYRDTDASAITMTVFDSAGSQVASTSLSDTTYDRGNIGWYNWYADADWHADSWFDAGDGGDGNPETVVDDFEDGDLAEYSFDRGSSGASVVSSPTYGGSHALEYAGTSVEAISTSGLNAYPSAGDTFSFRVRGTGGGDNINLSYGVQDHANRYFVRVNLVDDNLALYLYQAGSGTELAGNWSTPSLSQDAWYEVEVQWGTGGGHTVTLFDASGGQVAQISGSDPTWTSGGVGYDAYLSSGQYVYFDDVTIL